MRRRSPSLSKKDYQDDDLFSALLNPKGLQEAGSSWYQRFIVEKDATLKVVLATLCNLIPCDATEEQKLKHQRVAQYLDEQVGCSDIDPTAQQLFIALANAKYSGLELKKIQEYLVEINNDVNSDNALCKKKGDEESHAVKKSLYQFFRIGPKSNSTPNDPIIYAVSSKILQLIRGEIKNKFDCKLIYSQVILLAKSELAKLVSLDLTDKSNYQNLSSSIERLLVFAFLAKSMVNNNFIDQASFDLLHLAVAFDGKLLKKVVGEDDGVAQTFKLQKLTFDKVGIARGNSVSSLYIASDKRCALRLYHYDMKERKLIHEELTLVRQALSGDILGESYYFEAPNFELIEYVANSLQLDRYLHENSSTLGVCDRLRLVNKLLNLISDMAGKGVFWYDLKPENILLVLNDEGIIERFVLSDYKNMRKLDNFDSFKGTSSDLLTMTTNFYVGTKYLHKINKDTCKDPAVHIKLLSSAIAMTSLAALGLLDYSEQGNPKLELEGENASQYSPDLIEVLQKLVEHKCVAKTTSLKEIEKLCADLSSLIRTELFERVSFGPRK